MRTQTLAISFALGLAGVAGCGHPAYIAQTHIPDNATDRDIIEACEEYRTAVERRDAPAIIALVAPDYRSRAVSPLGNDVGYVRFRDVTIRRMADVKVITFNMQYRKVQIAGDQATVEVYEDASYQLRQDPDDQHWHRYADYGKLTLVHAAGRWLFTSGL